MTLREAVITVMTKARGPLGYREIWDEIDRRGLFASTGTTPWQTVGSILYSEPALFRKVSRGKFLLSRRGASKPARSSPDGQPYQRETRRGGLLDAIVQVLESANTDLHYTEVTDRVLRQRLWVPGGKTPAQTVGSYLYAHKEMFEQTSTGTFRLRRRGHVPSDTRTRSESRADGYEFERQVANLLEGMGFSNAEVTKASGDRGVDIWARYTTKAGQTQRVGIQTKNWTDGQVGSKGVRDLRGALRHDDVGILVATVGFSKEAWRIPNDMPQPRLILIDGDKLAELAKMEPGRLGGFARDMLG